MYQGTSQSMSPAAVRVQRVGLPLALAAAAATSFKSQMELAHLIGWGYHLAWLLPTAVVIWETMATTRWFGIPTTEAWKKVKKDARRQALLAVGTSSLLNNIWHLNDPAATAPLAITMLVSTVPNLVTFFLLHGSMSGPASSSAAVEEEVPPAPEPEPEKEEVPEVPAEEEVVQPRVRAVQKAKPRPAAVEEVEPAAQAPKRKRTMEMRKQQCRDYLTEVAEAGGNVEDVKPDDLMAKYRLSRRYWREILNDVRRERPADGWRRKTTVAA